jgi:hypothetical protein
LRHFSLSGLCAGINVGGPTYHSNMVSSSRDEIVEGIDALHTAVSRLLELSFDVLTTPERLRLLERLEHETRRLPVPGHALINQIRQQASPADIGGKLSHEMAPSGRPRPVCQ